MWCVDVTETSAGEYDLKLSRLQVVKNQPEADWTSEGVRQPDLELKLVRRAKEILRLLEERTNALALHLRLLFLLSSHGDVHFLGTSEATLKHNPSSRGFHRSSFSDSPSPYIAHTVRRVSPVNVSCLLSSPLRQLRTTADQEVQASETAGPTHPRRLDHVAMLHYHFNSSFALRYPGVRKAQRHRVSLGKIPLH